MISRRKRLGGTLSLLGAAATVAVVAGSTGLAAARAIPGGQSGASLASVSAAAGTKTAAASTTKSQDELIPLYDNANASDWTQACSTVNGAHGGSWIIADVDQGLGPGPAPVPAWASVIDNCYNYGRASVIGYVDTDYGQLSIATIESQINAWYSYYPGNIAGIFFDRVSDTIPGTTTSNVSFYRTLDSYVHKGHGDNDEVVLNYGASPGSGWMFSSSNANNADVVVTFESDYDTYTTWSPAAWEASYPASDFAALIYDTGESTDPQPASACGDLAKQNIGNVYVGTWYDVLPPYFSSFLADAAQGAC
jgi:Spherulation-specific family 4